jgi:hypothetical protein
LPLALAVVVLSALLLSVFALSQQATPTKHTIWPA